MRACRLFALLAVIAAPSALVFAQSPEVAPKFESIFNGKNLDGWVGDPVYWKAEDGVLVGEITPSTRIQNNTFIIWKGGVVGDFELKVDYRVSAQGNSGLNYRSYELVQPKLAMRGYQIDIDGLDRYSGNIYEEKGRSFLAFRGFKTLVAPNENPKLLELFGEAEQLQKTAVKKLDWNQIHLVVKGDHHRVSLNGTVVAETIDQDHVNGTRWGLIGVQVHVGPPMKIEYRNFQLARFPRAGEQEPKVEELLLSQEKLATLAVRQNPVLTPILNDQKTRFLAVEPASPIDGKQQLTVKSAPSFVKHELGRTNVAAAENMWDAVLVEGNQRIRAVNAAGFRAKADFAKTYTWTLAWDDAQKAYAVTNMAE